MLKSLDERFDILTKAIMDDAQSDAAKVRDDAQQKADEIMQDAKEQAEMIRKNVLSRAVQDAETLKEEKLSAEKMNAQMLWLSHREALLDKVFQEAQKRIPGLVSCPDYATYLEGLVKETLTNIQSDTVILHFDAQSQQFIQDEFIERIADETKIHITVGDLLETGTGVTAETTDGHRQYDNTLETRLVRQQQQLRASVYHVMMGENV
jgi:V/A-type H+-transporting ATPase subunit E